MSERKHRALSLGKHFLKSKDLLLAKKDGEDVIKIEPEAAETYNQKKEEKNQVIDQVVGELEYEMSDKEFKNPNFKKIKGV